MQEKTIVLFGGAFDPPHKGHLRMAEIATKQLQPNSFLWIPTANPPHRSHAKASFEQRCDMLELILPKHASWELCTIENESQALSYFSQTLKLLIEREGPCHFYVLIGQDQLDSFTRWHEWEYITDNATLLVMPRKDCKTTSLPNSKRTLMLEVPEVDICSTAIREHLHTIQKNQLPAEVYSYIQDNKLY